MVEVAVAVAAKIAEYLVAPLVRPFSYVWNYKSNFENLETEVQKLKSRRDSVQHSTEEARRNVEEIEEHVKDWLDRVEKMTHKVSEIIEEKERAKTKCFKGLCFNPKKRYQCSRKAAKKVNVVARLYDEGKFDRISYRTIPKETWIPSYKGYMTFQSRVSTLNNIINALTDPNVKMVSIYGTGGIGKTTLAREVAAHAEENKLFDVVAFAEVDVKPNIKEIQQDIADKLGLTFREESASGRARSLQERLKQEEKVLLILDNIWQELNLEEVGIPFSYDHKGCTVLLTTRSSDVSSKMNSETNFQIEFLNEEEAWSLFKKKVGACIENNEGLQALAIEVAKACGGLPIAVTSVAVALKGKGVSLWKDALKELKRPSKRSFEGVAAETYSCIEISYNQLKGVELKSTFLLCSIMRYTSIEDLMVNGVGLGIFESIQTIEEARDRVNSIVEQLKDSSLLLDANNKSFSMHDVVRDVARSIATRDGHVIIETGNVVPRELLKKDVLRNYNKISLHNIYELPNEFDCPQLEFFYINVEGNLLEVPDDFFTGMPKLRVLHLIVSNLKIVPTSLCPLVNLQTLDISCHNLGNIKFIGEMKQLEILRICSSNINELPEEMCNLKGLRLLDLRYCCNLQYIPPNVLSSLTQLEELYLSDHVYAFINWKHEEVNFLDELKCLSHLTALEIKISNHHVLPKGPLLSKKLERYKISIETYDFLSNNLRSSWDIFHGHEFSKRVKLLNLRSDRFSDDVLHKTPSVKKFLSVFDGEGFPEMELLHVEDSPGFCTVVDCLGSESCDLFPFLKFLTIKNLFNLKTIYDGRLRAKSFHQLTNITISRCQNLKNIFSFSTYKALPLLQVINVSSCDNMEEIFAIQEEDDINNNEGIDRIEFKQLCSLELSDLPKIKSFCSINNNEVVLDDTLDTPAPFFNKKFVFPNLEVLILGRLNCENLWHNERPAVFSWFPHLRQLRIENCENLKVLFSSSTVAFPFLEKIEISDMDNLEMIWPKQLSKDLFCNLTSLDVRSCGKLLTIFQHNVLGRITRLAYLQVMDCYSVKEIFDLQGVDFEESHLKIETQLLVMHILGLPNLKHIWNKDALKMFSFQKLKDVKVRGCENLKCLFPASIAENLLELEQLHISYCEIEEIVADEGEAAISTFVFPRITSLKLDSLPKLKTFSRGVHITKWLNLKKLGMHRCDEVELFASEFYLKGNNQGQHDISIQPLFVVNQDTFPSLEEIKISESNNLKIVWHQQAKESFCNPRTMEIEDCNKLLTIFQFNTLEGFSVPKSLSVSRCALVEQIFDLQNVTLEESNSTTLMDQLQGLFIKDLPNLKYIWNNEIVAKEGETKVAARFVFPEVTTIRLKKLPELKTFYPGIHTSKWPVLKKLKVFDCDKIESLATKIFNFQETNEKRDLDIPTQQPFFSVEKDSFPNLESLILQGKGVRMISQSQFSEQLYYNLNYLQVFDDDESVVFPCYILQAFPHLQTLHLVRSSYNEIVSYEEDETHAGMIAFPIRYLHLCKLYRLKHIWKQDSKLEKVLQKLEGLTVEYCHDLFQILPSPASFHNLALLCITSCERLNNLMTSSTAKSLVQLREMKIYDCESMMKVVEKEGEVTEDKITFHKLKTLSLYNLPWLSCFCSENYTFELPSLEELTVNLCHNMKYFSVGNVATPLLQKVMRNRHDYTLKDDLNTIIQRTQYW